MTSQRDQIAEAYFAIVALLGSRIISLDTRHQLEVFREYLEKELAQEDDKSDAAAAS